MKIWIVVTSVFLRAIILGCSTSDDAQQDNELLITPADYAILVSNSSGLYTKNIS